MPEDFAQITDGTGTKIRTRQRTIGANVVEEQYVIVQPEAVPANRAAPVPHHGGSGLHDGNPADTSAAVHG
jgi:hypothetical protein